VIANHNLIIPSVRLTGLVSINIPRNSKFVRANLP